MSCQICATPFEVKRYKTKGRLCSQCASTTPRKASRMAFDKAYWGSKYEEVAEGTRKEFYRDYMTSTHTVKESIEAPTHHIYDLY